MSSLEDHAETFVVPQKDGENPTFRRQPIGSSPYFDAQAAASTREEYQYEDLVEPANCCQNCGHVLGLQYRRLNGRSEFGQHDHVVFACIHCVDEVEMIRGAGRIPDYQKGDLNQEGGR